MPTPVDEQLPKQKHYYMNEYDKIECTKCQLIFESKATFAVHWFEDHEDPDNNYLVKKRGRPSSRKHLRCPDCFVKTSSPAVLMNHLNVGCDIAGPTLRKRGRPVKYHPIPSQKLTEEFHLPTLGGLPYTPPKKSTPDPTYEPLNVLQPNPPKLPKIEKPKAISNHPASTPKLVPVNPKDLATVKRKNREAAQRCRERKRERDNALQIHVAELKGKNGILEKEIFHLRETRLRLREALQLHETTNCKGSGSLLLCVCRFPTGLSLSNRLLLCGLKYRVLHTIPRS